MQNMGCFGNCSFVACAYFHTTDGVNQRIETLESVVKELKYEVGQLKQNEKKDTSEKLDFLTNEVKDLQENIKQLNNNIKATEMLVKQFTDKNDIKDNAKSKEGNGWFYC